NPLTVVIGYAGLLSEEARAVAAVDATRSQKLLEYANVVEKAAEYCHHLAANGRQSARKHAESERVDQVGGAEAVRQVMFFGNSSIVLTGLPQAVVRGSKFELMRIFQNLFKNALEAGANTLTMQVKQAGDSFELGLSDDGSGMAPDAVKKALRGGFS